MSRDPYRHYRRRHAPELADPPRRIPVSSLPYPYEPVAALAFAALGRFAYRHRSAFCRSSSPVPRSSSPR